MPLCIAVGIGLMEPVQKGCMPVAMAVAIAVSNKWFFIFRLRGFVLLPAPMKQWQVHTLISIVPVSCCMQGLEHTQTWFVDIKEFAMWLGDKA